MIKTLVIKPYIGLGPIKFGYSESDIKQILGKPLEEIKTFFGNKRLEYFGMGLVFENKKLVEINVVPGINLMINDHKIFGNANIIRVLKELDEDPINVQGYLVFFKIGLAISNFESSVDTPVVNLFVKGYWDNFKQY